jgi:hypothetical protein
MGQGEWIVRDRKPDITPDARALTAATKPPGWLSKDAKGGRSIVSQAVAPQPEMLWTLVWIKLLTSSVYLI